MASLGVIAGPSASFCVILYYKYEDNKWKVSLNVVKIKKKNTCPA